MRRVPLNEVLPGMILAKAVTNSAGLPVMAAGGELNEAVIHRLRQLNLSSVYVEGHGSDGAGKTLAELHAEAEHRFRAVLDDPIQVRILAQVKMLLDRTHGVTDEKREAP